MRPGILDSITGVNQQLAQQNVAPQSDSLDLSQSDISNFDPASGRASTSEFESIQTNDSVSGTGNMTNADFYPSANQPIQKGSISTKTFGGTPIFVPSTGLTPLNILDKKEAALDEIKRKRQERQAKLDLGAPPKLADARFQKSVDNTFMNMRNKYISIAKDMYGKDWDIGLTSDQTELGRRFKQEMRDLQTLKSQSDVVTKQAADIISKVEAGEISTDSKSYQLANEIMKGIGEYEKGNATDLTKNINQFKQSVVLDNWLNKNILGQLKMTESSGPLRTLANAIETGSFVELSEYESKNVKQQAKAIAERLKRNEFKHDDLITEKDIEDAINQRFGSVYKVSNKVQAKPSSYGKQESREESVDLRLEKVNAIKNPFDANGAIKPDSERFLQGLVNGIHNKKVISGASFRKGGDTPELNKVSSDLASVFVEGSKVKPDKIVSSLKSKQFDNGTISGTIENIEFDDDMIPVEGMFNDDKSGAKLTIKSVDKDGNITYNEVLYDLEDNPNIENQIKSDLSKDPSFAPLKDAIVLNLVPSSARDQETESVIELDSKGVDATINGILTTTSGEGGLKIKHDELLKRERALEKEKAKSGNKIKKVKRSELEADLAKYNNSNEKKITIEQLVKALETQKNITLVIED